MWGRSFATICRRWHKVRSKPACCRASPIHRFRRITVGEKGDPPSTEALKCSTSPEEEGVTRGHTLSSVAQIFREGYFEPSRGFVDLRSTED
jgi:hypothetical protein